jgi:NADH-quinone oxidoreductase subunit N
MKLPEIDLYLIAPEIVLCVAGLLVLLVDAFSPRESRKSGIGVLSLAGIVVAGAYTICQMGTARSGFGGMVLADGFSLFFKLTFLIIAFLTVSSPPSA